MCSLAFQAAVARFMCSMTSRAKGVASGSVWERPVMYLTHSYSPA